MSATFDQEHPPALRIGLCWGHLALAESDYLRRFNQGGLSLPMADFFDRHRDRAHRRYLQAVKALAQVRKLLGASVTQVNIAENQVNVAGRLRAPST